MRPSCFDSLLSHNGLEQLDVLQGGVHDVGVCLRNLAFGQLAEDLRRIDILLRLAGLTRQQARDSALSLLKEAIENDDVDAETASEAAKSIETLASYTLSEAQIENMVTAKGYEDCVVFMSEDGVSVVVSTGEEGLQTEDIARITDIVKQETGLSAESIKIMEVN